MLANRIHNMTATEIVQQIRDGHITAEKVTRACLEHIAEREPAVQAWAFIDPALAIQQAQALDQGPIRGALHGVPVGIKDIIDTVDMPTAYGTPIHAGHQPNKDAACVALTRRAGGVILGKQYPLNLQIATRVRPCTQWILLVRQADPLAALVQPSEIAWCR